VRTDIQKHRLFLQNRRIPWIFLGRCFYHSGVLKDMILTSSWGWNEALQGVSLTLVILTEGASCARIQRFLQRLRITPRGVGNFDAIAIETSTSNIEKSLEPQATQRKLLVFWKVQGACGLRRKHWRVRPQHHRCWQYIRQQHVPSE
jgi:hypothetical protein